MIFGEKIPFDTILDGIAKLEKEMNEITSTLAEKVGFEPMCPLRQTHFELYPFDRLWTISLEIVGM